MAQYGTLRPHTVSREAGIVQLQSKKVHVVIEELCRARVIVRDAGKVPFPPEPQRCAQDWTASVARQELSQQLYLFKPQLPSTGARTQQPSGAAAAVAATTSGSAVGDGTCSSADSDADL